jgi:hypothetical protein
VRRFLGALRPGGPAPADTAWVATILGPGEADLFGALPGHDRRHAVAVARRVDVALGGAPNAVLAAALLHDSGKVHARMGPARRALATVWLAVRGRERVAADRNAWSRRCAVYAAHPALGAAEIPEAAAWAEAHHDLGRWPTTGLEPRAMAALHAADDD